MNYSTKSFRLLCQPLVFPESDYARLFRRANEFYLPAVDGADKSVDCPDKQKSAYPSLLVALYYPGNKHWKLLDLFI